MDRSSSSLTISCPVGVPLLSNARTSDGSEAIRFQGSHVSYPALKQALMAVVVQVVAIHSKGGWLLEALNDFSQFQDDH